MTGSTHSLRREEILNAITRPRSAILQSRESHRADRTAVPTARVGSRRWLVATLALGLVMTAAIALSKFALASHFAAQERTPAPVLERGVSVVQPIRDMKQTELLLPADVLAFQTTDIHARIGGYLKAWYVDRGARVQAGQVLAEIDAPEFDQELRQARSELDEGRAQLAQSRTERDQAIANLAATRANVLKADANLELALKTMQRFKDLEEHWAASRQQYDETVRNHEAAKAEVAAAKANVGSFEAAVATREAAIRTAEARVNSLLANVRRLEETEGFKKLVAPFAGVITRRGLDVGALVPKDGSREIFSIAQDDMLRVTVNVPQAYAALIREGQDAQIVAPEFAQEHLRAKVARSAGAIDSAARTLAVELELQNAERKLMSGAFTQVRFLIRDPHPTLQVPSSTLRFTKEGPQVVTVNENEQLESLTVKLGRDFGSRVEVVSGLQGHERLVVNPSDGMTNGEKVKVASSTAVAAK